MPPMHWYDNAWDTTLCWLVIGEINWPIHKCYWYSHWFMIYWISRLASLVSCCLCSAHLAECFCFNIKYSVLLEYWCGCCSYCQFPDFPPSLNVPWFLLLFFFLFISFCRYPAINRSCNSCLPHSDCMPSKDGIRRKITVYPVRRERQATITAISTAGVLDAPHGAVAHTEPQHF